MRWAGYRNVVLILIFFGWATAMVRMFEPPDGKWTPELVSGVSTFLGVNGTTFIGMLLGRAANKWAEKRES